MCNPCQSHGKHVTMWINIYYINLSYHMFLMIPLLYFLSHCYRSSVHFWLYGFWLYVSLRLRDRNHPAVERERKKEGGEKKLFPPRLHSRAARLTWHFIEARTGSSGGRKAAPQTPLSPFARHSCTLHSCQRPGFVRLTLCIPSLSPDSTVFGLV